MNIFSPDTGFKDFREIAQFNFFWRLFLVGTLLTLLLAIINFFFFQEVLEYYAGGFIFDSLILMFLWKYKKYYKWFAGTYSIVVFNVIGLSLFNSYLVTELHVQAILWMLMVCVLVYFTINHIFGSIFIFGIIIYFSIYYNFYFSSEVLETSLHEINELSSIESFVLSLELALPLAVIAYTMYQYRIVNNYAINNAMNALDELKAEKQIVEKQSQEKTILLQEIHHRVKNNLQIIISLLRLQSNDLNNMEAKMKFDEAITRIMTMSLIHQKMYERETLIEINIKDYFESLINNLIKVHATDSKVIFQIEGDLKTLNADIMIPIGLIINELVSNTLKHAFKEKESGELKEIKVIFNQSENENIQLTYRDNGTWTTSKTKSFGAELIEIFTEQLDGNFERSITEEGTIYDFNLQSNLIE